MGGIGLALAGAALAFGCAAPPPQPRVATFVEAEYAPFAQVGTGVIDGQAFLKTRDGNVKFGAGCPVYMNPVTTYSTEWWTRTILQNVVLEPADPRVAQYMHQAVADGNGNFRFEGLAAGDYYIACPITWEYVAGATQYGPYTSTTGGFACARVTVQDGQTTRAVVTR